MRTMISKTGIFAAFILLLSIGLTLLSLRFVRPVTCLEVCDTPEPSPCPPQACRFYEQRAGLPVPFLIDAPGGGSPTTGWGKLGPEDMPNPLTFLLDVLFYGALIWLVGYFGRWRFRRKRPAEVELMVLSFVWVTICLGIGFYLYLPFYYR